MSKKTTASAEVNGSEQFAKAHGYAAFPPCEAVDRRGRKCGMPSKYLLGYEGEIPMNICSLHESRASTLGWPTRKRRNND